LKTIHISIPIMKSKIYLEPRSDYDPFILEETEEESDE
jgi:hypothetical protein